MRNISRNLRSGFRVPTIWETRLHLRKVCQTDLKSRGSNENGFRHTDCHAVQNLLVTNPLLLLPRCLCSTSRRLSAIVCGNLCCFGFGSFEIQYSNLPIDPWSFLPPVSSIRALKSKGFTDLVSKPLHEESDLHAASIFVEPVAFSLL